MIPGSDKGFEASGSDSWLRQGVGSTRGVILGSDNGFEAPGGDDWLRE